MKIDLNLQECRWLIDLASKEKNAARMGFIETGHPLLELRRDNMSDLHSKLEAVVQKELRKERNRAR
jgi:hypothetical protein